MKIDQISLENDQLTLSVKRPSKIILTISFGMAILFFLLPCIIFVAIMTSSEEGNPLLFEHLVFLSFPFFCGIYFFRIALWNYFGKEIYTFDNEFVHYKSDFGWFKDGNKSFRLDEIFFFFSLNKQTETHGFLMLADGKNEMESVVKLNNDDLQELIEFLESNYAQ